MKQRIEWVDTAKGILIILVVLGHCHVNRMTDMIINSFHMVAFFSLSGVTFNGNRSFYDFIHKKVMSLIIPYIVFAAVYLLYQYAKTFVFSATHFDLLSGLISVVVPISGRETTSVYGLWFFPCLFLAEVFYYLLMKISNKTKVGTIVLFIFISVVCVETYYIFGVASVISILPFATASLSLGKMLANISNKIRKYKEIVFSASLCTFVFAIILNFTYSQSVDLSSMTLGCIPFYAVSSISGTVLVYIISMIFPTNRVLHFFGKDSMYYYGLHYEVLGIIEKFVQGGGVADSRNICCANSCCDFL